MREYENGRWRGMTRQEVTAADSLMAEFGGQWLYDLTSSNEGQATQAQQRLDGLAETFRAFNEAQQVYFLGKFYATPSDIPTVLKIGFAFGLAIPTSQ